VKSPYDTRSVDEDREVRVKRCPRCGETKPLEAFYVSRGRPDGRTGWCGACHLTSVKEWQATHGEQYLAYQRSYSQSHAHPTTTGHNKPGGLTYQERVTPEMTRLISRVRYAVKAAVRDGRLIRPAVCEQCGEGGRDIDAAHSDYMKPLDVRWLCNSCHARWDAREPKSLGPNRGVR